MLIHDAKSGENVAVDYREMAPQGATRDMYLDENGDVDTQRARFSHLAAGVPGTVAGFHYAHQKFGRLPKPIKKSSEGKAKAKEKAVKEKPSKKAAEPEKKAAEPEKPSEATGLKESKESKETKETKKGPEGSEVAKA